MANEAKDTNDLNVNGAKDGNDKRVIVLGAGDPALIQQDNRTYVGTVKSVDKDNVTLTVKNNSEVKELTAPMKDFEALYFENADSKKVWTKFSYNEIARAQRNTENFKVDIASTQIVALMLGNRSPIVSFDKMVDDKMITVQGKIELRRGADGNATVSHLVKNKELNLDRPVYGVKLNDAQKEQLTKTGELGLVNGFKSGEKEYSLWVSLDKDLNSVVTKREKDINIDKIYGVQLDETQKNKIKSGEGALVELKNGEKVFILASASTSKADGLKIYSEEKAKEFNLIKDEKKNDLKEGNQKKSGMKI